MNFGGLMPAGALTVVFAFAMYRQYRDGVALTISSAFVAAAGASRQVAGIFPCDPGCSMENMSASARIHSVAGLAAFVSGILAPVLFAVGIRVKQHRLFWPSLLLGAGALAAFAIGAQQGAGSSCIGVWQRLNLLCFYAWVVVVAIAGAIDERSKPSA